MEALRQEQWERPTDGPSHVGSFDAESASAAETFRAMTTLWDRRQWAPALDQVRKASHATRVKDIGDPRVLMASPGGDTFWAGALPRLSDAIHAELQHVDDDGARALCLDAFAIRRDLYFMETPSAWEELQKLGERLAADCVPRLAGSPDAQRLHAILDQTPDLGHSWQTACTTDLISRYGIGLTSKARQRIGGYYPEAEEEHIQNLEAPRIALLPFELNLALTAEHMLRDCDAVALALSTPDDALRASRMADIDACSLQGGLSIVVHGGHVASSCYAFENDLAKRANAYFELERRLDRAL